MLILISDIHLNDGTEDTNVSPDAFEIFRGSVLRMAESALSDLPPGKKTEIELVFLGDILDVIHSSCWQTPKGGLSPGVRPWTGSAADLDAYASVILEDIVGKNAGCKTELGKLKNGLGALEKVDNVRFTFVPGNHDRLLYRTQSPELRKRVIDFLHLDHNEAEPFEREILRPEYGVFARHGDMQDRDNWDGETKNSCLGDVIVIDLLCRFIHECEEQFGASGDQSLVRQLKEVYNVRPLVAIPAWAYGACRRYRPTQVKHIAEDVKEIWGTCLRDFLKDDFVKEHDRRWRGDLVDMLQWGDVLSAGLSLARVSKIASRLSSLFDSSKKYAAAAYEERAVKDGQARYVVYGHTHEYGTFPLDEREGNAIMYFNTGTWKHVQRRTLATPSEYEFLSWNTMTYVAFYREEERSARPFEAWHGVLAPRQAP